jgi:hypothetical protein
LGFSFDATCGAGIWRNENDHMKYVHFKGDQFCGQFCSSNRVTAVIALQYLDVATVDPPQLPKSVLEMPDIRLRRLCIVYPKQSQFGNVTASVCKRKCRTQTCDQ